MLLISFGFIFYSCKPFRPASMVFQSENGVFSSLSTKLSTGSVDKNKNPLVYRGLAALLMFYMRSVLQCMIFYYPPRPADPDAHRITASWPPRACRTGLLGPNATTMMQVPAQLCTICGRGTTGLCLGQRLHKSLKPNKNLFWMYCPRKLLLI